MEVVILGSGTSQGIPVIGCSCEVCMSEDVKDQRLRCSIVISVEGTNILIDTSPDLRQQMLANKIAHIDAVIYTHEHNDHVVGLDDLRPFNFMQRMDMPIYGTKRVLDDIEQRFSYAFTGGAYPGAPRMHSHYIEAGKTFDVKGIAVTALEVMHGNLPILAYRIGDFAYVTDASFISDESMAELRGLDVLVLNALQPEPHHSHFTRDEALEKIKELQPKQAYITHISHRMGKVAAWREELPPNVDVAYDTMIIKCSAV